MKNLVEPIKLRDDVKAIEAYLADKSSRNRLIWAFGINTGLRVSDILGLNLVDVKNKSYVEIIEKKTKKYKRFPLNNKLQALLKDYLNERERLYSIIDEEPLFISKKHLRLTRSQVYRILNDAGSACKLSVNIGTHTMRKTFGYHHYKKFKDVALLQKILNHSAPSITLRYIGVAQEELDNSYSNFEL